jgi:hypothetical protein
LRDLAAADAPGTQIDGAWHQRLRDVVVVAIESSARHAEEFGEGV